MMSAPLGPQLHGFFVDYLVAQKGLRVTSIRSYRDTLRLLLAFVARDGRNKELCVMGLDGADAIQLTHDKSIALSPAWSPEGSLLLFTSYRCRG